MNGLKLRLEDRLQHQLQRRLDHPVGHRRDPQLADLARPALRNQLLPHRQRLKLPRFQPLSNAFQVRPVHRPAPECQIRSSRPHPQNGPLGVARDPIERHHQRRRVIHQVVQIIETDGQDRPSPIGAIWSASVVPAPAPTRRQATRPKHSPRDLRPSTVPSLLTSLSPFAMWPALPTSDYYGVLRPVTAGSADGGPSPTRVGHAVSGTSVTVPVFTDQSPSVKGGAWLYPCGIATTTPRHFVVASSRPSTSPTRSSPPIRAGTHRTQPSARFPAGGPSGASHTSSSRTPLHSLAEPAPSGSTWHVPASSGAACRRARHLPNPTAPQLHPPAATGRRWRSLTSTRSISASRRTWPSHHLDGRSQPGKAQPPSRRTSARRSGPVKRRRCRPTSKT